MALDIVGLLLALLLSQPGTLDAALPGGAVFQVRDRAVSNWRLQAAANLDATPGVRADLLVGRDPAAVTRCVRLNNYWCIKRAGWIGEIASDADGHVAFRSAADGATIAALLLRRYYVVDGRHSALAIVSHWAPASCGGPASARRPASARVVPTGLASRGLGRTLRARWLAAHGHRAGAFGRGRVRASRIPDRLLGATLPAPAIALGLGPAPVSLSAALPDVLAGGSAPVSATGLACTADTTRIAHYAARAAAGIAASPTADLALFDATGQPTPKLAQVMRNMAAVEIGPLGASQGLVETAVAQATAVVAARRVAPAGSGAPPGPGATPGSRIDEGRRPEPAP